MTSDSKGHSEIRASLTRCLIKPRPPEQWTSFLDEMHGDLYIGVANFGRGRLNGQDEEIAYECLMELYRAGIVIFRNNSKQYGFPWIMLTSMGKRALEDDSSWFFSDTGTYLDLVKRKVPSLDTISEAYLREASNCYHSNNVTACYVMLGVALEKRFDFMLQSVLKSSKGELFQPVTQENFFGAKVRKFHNIVQAKNPFPKELRETLSTKLISTLEVIRQARNENGHPTKIPDDDREYAYVLLRLFISIAGTMQTISDLP